MHDVLYLFMFFKLKFTNEKTTKLFRYKCFLHLFLMHYTESNRFREEMNAPIDRSVRFREQFKRFNIAIIKLRHCSTTTETLTYQTTNRSH